MFNLSSFFRADRNTPFQNPKAATKWIADLKKEDAAAWMPIAVQKLRAFLDEGQQISEAKLQALFVIDEALQAPHAQAVEQYIHNPRMAKVLLDKLWGDVVSVARVMISAYRLYIELSVDHPEEKQLEQHLHLVMVRTLRYLSIEAKWHYFRLDQLSPKFWSLTHQIYRLSELAGSDAIPIALYSGEEVEQTTCADEYIRILLMDSVNTGAFNVKQFETISQWLSKCTHLVSVDRKHQEGLHDYMVDLAQALPMSWVEKQRYAEMCRYLSVGDLVSHIDALLRRLEKGESPRVLGLGDEWRASQCIELLDILKNTWSRRTGEEDQRLSERVEVKKIIDVVHDLPNIVHVLRLFSGVDVSERDGLSADTPSQISDLRFFGFVSNRIKQQQQVRSAYGTANGQFDFEQWLVENQSDGGLGAALMPIDNDWLRQGSLLGVREQKGEWRVAIVRRLAKMGKDKLYAGVQLMSQPAIAVKMQPASFYANSSGYGRVDSVSTNNKNALMIPSGFMQSKPGLIMPSVEYMAGKAIRISGSGVDQQVTLGNVIEKSSDDWVWVAIEVNRQVGR